MSDEAKATTAEAPEEAAPEAAESPGLEESVEGFKLDEMGGAQVGKVASTLKQDGSSEAEWLVARMGRFGHFCLVPARDAVAINGRVWVPYSRDQIRRAPRVDPNGPPSAEVTTATRDHYGLG
jgi:hypothetical protein